MIGGAVELLVAKLHSNRGINGSKVKGIWEETVSSTIHIGVVWPK